MKTIITLLATTGLLMTSCKKDENGNIKIMMTDAPATYLQVNVDVKQARIKYADDEGWTNLSTNAGVYNLLDLQNNVTTTIADEDDLKTGRVNQFRLILGQNNTVMLSDSTVEPLELSSQDETGLKLNLNSNIESEKETIITVDFDAGESVIENGNGTFKLKPVLKTKSVLNINI